MINTYSLISLDDAKAFIPQTGSKAADDDLIESLIDSVSTLFEVQTGRKFLSREHTETHNGLGTSSIFPKQYPITTISGIWDDSERAWTVDKLVDSDDYVIVDDNYISFDVTLGDHNQNIKIIYTAGYSETPYDLKQACIDEVVRIYKGRDKIDMKSNSSPSGTGTTYVDKTLSLQTMLILDKYRKKSIC